MHELIKELIKDAGFNMSIISPDIITTERTIEINLNIPNEMLTLEFRPNMLECLNRLAINLFLIYHLAEVNLIINDIDSAPYKYTLPDISDVDSGISVRGMYNGVLMLNNDIIEENLPQEFGPALGSSLTGVEYGGSAF